MWWNITEDTLRGPRASFVVNRGFPIDRSLIIILVKDA